jgi:SAM-dependent methyltransferase
MGAEQKDSYYDQLFLKRADYHTHYKDSHYYVHWTQVIKFLRHRKEANILEVGCGPGQLAKYLQDEKYLNYQGFDFSSQAIEMAERMVPEFNFFRADALEAASYPDNYDIVICLEVLEHLKADKTVIRNIREGKEIIFSIPRFDDPSHVRWFLSEYQIKKRYYTLIDIKAIIRVGEIYICKGIRSDFRPNLYQRILKVREPIALGGVTARIRHRIKNTFKLKKL